MNLLQSIIENSMNEPVPVQDKLKPDARMQLRWVQPVEESIYAEHRTISSCTVNLIVLDDPNPDGWLAKRAAAGSRSANSDVLHTEILRPMDSDEKLYQFIAEMILIQAGIDDENRNMPKGLPLKDPFVTIRGRSREGVHYQCQALVFTLSREDFIHVDVIHEPAH